MCLETPYKRQGRAFYVQMEGRRSFSLMAENGRYRAVKEKYALRQRSGIYTRHTRGFIEKPVAIYYLYMQM